MRPVVRFSLEGVNDGDFNMARDAELLTLAESGELSARLYQWPEPWVSLGRSQTRAEALIHDGWPPATVRPTGGAAVLHGHDLTFSVAVPLTMLGLGPRQVKAIYRRLVGWLVAAMEGRGQEVALAEDLMATEKHRSPFCFALKSPNDVLHRGSLAKAAGCALRVTAHAALLQASVPIRAPAHDPAEFMREAEPLVGTPRDPVRFFNALAAAFRSEEWAVEPAIGSAWSLRDVQRVGLWNVWDPIGVNDCPTAADEYEDYLLDLARPEEEIREKLRRLREESIGVGDEELDSRYLAWLRSSRAWGSKPYRRASLVQLWV